MMLRLVGVNVQPVVTHTSEKICGFVLAHSPSPPVWEKCGSRGDATARREKKHIQIGFKEQKILN